MIPESFIQELLRRVDIVEVVGRHVPLKKAGQNYAACCPFHTEKTPSFTVSPVKQFYHCFGCGAHGTAIGFLMEYAGLGFVDAVRDLATGAGMPVPQDERRRPEAPTATPALTDIMARAARYYREQLRNAPDAIAYLKERGLTGEIAARFGVGYAPPGWQNLREVFPDYGDPALLACGLVIDADSGRRYDRFRHRIMFPIQDARGNVIAFGGRMMPGGADGQDAGPKYLNSPETPLFEKGQELYGLTQARHAIRDDNRVIVVEGYMDVVGLAQHGIGNAVAALGTATTPTHVHKLLRLADHVVFCFDKDAAGLRAAWRALEVCLEHVTEGKHVGFAFMPGDQDPDEYIRAHGADAFLRFVRQPKPLSEFLVGELRNRGNPSTAEGRAALLADARSLLVKVQAPLLRLAIVKELARVSGFSQREVEAACGMQRPAEHAPHLAHRAPPPPRRRPRSLARTLMKLLLTHPELAEQFPLELAPHAGPEAESLAAVSDALASGVIDGASYAGVLEHFRDSPHVGLIGEVIAEAVEEPIEEDAIATLFHDTLRRLRLEANRARFTELSRKAGTEGLNDAEKREFAQLLVEKQRLSART